MTSSRKIVDNLKENSQTTTVAAPKKITGNIAIGGPLAPTGRFKKRSAGGLQLRKSGGPELRKSDGLQPRKLGGPPQRKSCRRQNAWDILQYISMLVA